MSFIREERKMRKSNLVCVYMCICVYILIWIDMKQ